MDWSHIQFGSIAPYIGGVLIVGGALVGSMMPPALKARLEIYVLLPGLLLAEIVLAGDAVIWEHSWFRGACFAALSVITGAWLLRRLRTRPQPTDDPSLRK
jgi:hypothetical protein